MARRVLLVTCLFRGFDRAGGLTPALLGGLRLQGWLRRRYMHVQYEGALPVHLQRHPPLSIPHCVGSTHIHSVGRSEARCSEML